MKKFPYTRKYGILNLQSTDYLGMPYCYVSSSNGIYGTQIDLFELHEKVKNLRKFKIYSENNKKFSKIVIYLSSFFVNFSYDKAGWERHSNTQDVTGRL